MLHTYCSQPHSCEPLLEKKLEPQNINGPFYTPVELATLYGFPNDVDGTGQTVGIIELGGGYTVSDFHAYLTAIGVTKVPNVVDVSVNGGVNSPGLVGDSVEVCLDLDIVAAIAPGANIRMYFAPNAFTYSFVAAVQAAVNDGCNIISISWGAPELYWDSENRTALNNIFQQAANAGITIFCASGDNGASDGKPGLNVDFPGSSPHGVSCGGTTVTSANGVITSETVWGNATNSATGGGISALFSKPSYQNTVPLLNTYSFRGTPDIAANADPSTGYIVRVGPAYKVVGGTSAVSPLLSALTALVNQKRLSAGKPVLGFIQRPLYTAPLSVFRDITQGGNFGYQAAVGWDFTTGLGSPSAELSTYLINYVAPGSPTSSFTASTLSGVAPLSVTFTDTSTGSPTAWSWNFGNGSSSTLQNPSATFNTAGTFTVSLTVTNAAGSSTSSQTVTVTEPVPTPPVCSFSSNKMSGTVPLSVAFTDTSTGGLPTAWSWNFGNGSTSTQKNPSTVLYNVPGTYTITLTVSNAAGSSSSSKTVTATSIPVAPVSLFSVSPSSGNAPLVVNFTNSSTGNPTSWLWTFGNGSTSTLQNPGPVTFTTARTYSVSLRVTNSIGSSTSTRTVTVSPAPPVANFTASNRTVTFTDTSTNSPTSWLWNFGDGSTSTIRNPTKTYANAGTYTVTLRASNSSGFTIVTKTVNII